MNLEELHGRISDFGINGIIREYEVSANGNISVGDFIDYISEITSYSSPVKVSGVAVASVTALSDTKAIVTYLDGDNANYGTAVIITFSDTTIAVGTPVVFESASTNYVSALALSDTKVIVTYRDNGSSNYGTAVILTISNIAITVGTPVVFKSANCNYITATILSSTKVLVTFQNYSVSGYGIAGILTITDTIITVGAQVTFESASTSWISVTALSSTKAVVTYQDEGNSGYGTAVVLTIGDSTFTAGTPVVFEGATTAYISVVTLSDTKVLVAYRDNGNSNFGTAIVLTMNDTVITAGAPVVFESATTSYISAVILSDMRVLVAYQDEGDNGYGTAVILTISGTAITVSPPVVFNNVSTTYTSVTALSNTKVVVTYRDAVNTNAEITVVLTAKEFALLATSKSSIIGVAKTSGIIGEKIKAYTL